MLKNLLKEPGVIHKHTVNTSFVAVEEANTLSFVTNFNLSFKSPCFR